MHAGSAPLLVHIVARVPGAKIDDDDVIVSQRLELGKHVVPQRQIEPPKRSQENLRAKIL